MPETYSGASTSLVAALGDVDGGGSPDLAISLIDRSLIDLEGRLAVPPHLAVYSGETGDLLYEIASPSGDPERYFGWSVARIDDANGDGVLDFAVGEPAAEPDSVWVYTFSGTDGSLLASTSLSPPIQPPPSEGPPDEPPSEEPPESLSVWPNPVADVLRITGGPVDPDLIDVLDVLGHRVASFEAVDTSSLTAPLVLDVRGWAPGLYFVRSIGENVETRHFTVVH